MSTSPPGVVMHIKKDNICKVPGNNRFSVNINYCENKELCSYCCLVAWDTSEEAFTVNVGVEGIGQQEGQIKASPYRAIMGKSEI